jgi:hypothetical protein
MVKTRLTQLIGSLPLVIALQMVTVRVTLHTKQQKEKILKSYSLLHKVTICALKYLARVVYNFACFVMVT